MGTSRKTATTEKPLKTKESRIFFLAFCVRAPPPNKEDLRVLINCK